MGWQWAMANGKWVAGVGGGSWWMVIPHRARSWLFVLWPSGNCLLLSVCFNDGNVCDGALFRFILQRNVNNSLLFTGKVFERLACSKLTLQIEIVATCFDLCVFAPAPVVCGNIHGTADPLSLINCHRKLIST